MPARWGGSYLALHYSGHTRIKIQAGIWRRVIVLLLHATKTSSEQDDKIVKYPVPRFCEVEGFHHEFIRKAIVANV